MEKKWYLEESSFTSNRAAAVLRGMRLIAAVALSWRCWCCALLIEICC